MDKLSFWNVRGEKQALWDQLKNLKDMCTSPWCICGDFNSLLNFNERIGSEVAWHEINEFRQCVSYCEVTDIQVHGSFFTWNNKQNPSTRVFSRIDRCLINMDWMILYPNSYAYFMNEGTFDHCPCICYKTIDQPIRKPCFRYFNMWSLDPFFKTIIQHQWNKPVLGVKMFQVVTKLRNLKQPLKNLNKHQFSDVERSADIAKVLLDELQSKLQQNPYDHHTSLAEREAAVLYTLLQ
ncbi:uncharacterized protein LOC141619930 [Silene latifolia]|uniref:uncharacterized protein LOC141619930 n=1 Tax=Silene latifolia TaxID=37657 RepID=UPI003D770284